MPITITPEETEIPDTDPVSQPEILLAVETPFGHIHKRCSYELANSFNSVAVAVSTANDPEGKPKSAIVASFWTHYRPTQAAYMLQRNIQHMKVNGIEISPRITEQLKQKYMTTVQYFGYEVKQHHRVLTQPDCLLTRLQVSLQGLASLGVPFNLDDLLDDASITLTDFVGRCKSDKVLSKKIDMAIAFSHRGVL